MAHSGVNGLACLLCVENVCESSTKHDCANPSETGGQNRKDRYTWITNDSAHMAT